MSTPQLQVGGGMSGLLKEGYKHLSGMEQAVLRNIEACNELGKLTRTSMGPNGMNKLIVNHLGKVAVTSATSTIISELEVEHPAAKMLVMAAKMQQDEFGDYANFVVTFASEMLHQAKGLIRIGVHPSEIVLGFKKATDATLEYLERLSLTSESQLMALSPEDARDANKIANAVKSAISAKFHDFDDLLSKLVGDACAIAVSQKSKQNSRPSLDMDNVRVSKFIGGSIYDSSVLKGMVIRRAPSSLKKDAYQAKVAVFGTNVEASDTETKGTVLINNAEELLSYNQSEENLLEEQVKGMKDSGVDVVVSGGTISDMALHFVDKYDMMILKVTSKFELRRICRTTNATPLNRLGPVLPEEMGYCDLVETREISGEQCIVFQQEREDSSVATVLLRSSTSNQLDDLERAIDDGVNTCKTLCEDGRLLPGGGATEIALSLHISKLGESTPGLEQYAINKFAEALEVVPRTLAENAGFDSTVVISNLYAAHKRGDVNHGVNVLEGGSADMVANSILDSYAAKHQAIRLATDAAITILRVDQIIMAKAAGGPKIPQQ